jgi:hypothetical protein
MTSPCPCFINKGIRIIRIILEWRTQRNPHEYRYFLHNPFLVRPIIIQMALIEGLNMLPTLSTHSLEGPIHDVITESPYMEVSHNTACLSVHGCPLFF